MEYNHVIPAQLGEFAFKIEIPNSNHETTLTRTPVIGYCIYISETNNEEIKTFTFPLCTVGENMESTFIKRYDGTFTDINGEHQFYTLIDVMNYYGYEPDDPNSLLPNNPNELSTYIWRPQRCPKQ